MTRLLILHCLDGLGIGGAERQLVLLLRHVPRQMFDHVVCHLGPRRGLAPEIQAMGIPVFDLSDGDRRSLLALIRLLRLVRRRRPALIHADHDFGKLCGMIAGALLRVPVLATMGNTLPESMSGLPSPHRDRKMRLLDWVDRVIPDRPSDHYMAVSHAVWRSLIADDVSADRITLVYRGLDLDEFVPDSAERLAALRTALTLEGAGPILLNVGRLVNQKGQEDIIQALPAICRIYPRVQLLLAGEGPNREAYRTLAEREGVAEHVQFLGLRQDVRQLLQLADVFVFPSRREGTGVALLEAMAGAKPCVVSRIPVLEEVVGTDGAGVLVPPRRADLFAEAVLALLADPLRGEAMGRRAREIVEERFDIRKNALDFARLCLHVIEAGRARHPVEVMP